MDHGSTNYSSILASIDRIHSAIAREEFGASVGDHEDLAAPSLIIPDTESDDAPADYTSLKTEFLLDHEFLELVLFLVLPKRDASRVARVLLDKFGSFSRVITASRTTLRSTQEVGDAVIAVMKIVQVAAVMLARSEISDVCLLDNFAKVVRYLRSVSRHREGEELRVIFLDVRNRLIADEVMARGPPDACTVYPREIIKRAIELRAVALILARGGSNAVGPSDHDIAMILELIAATKAIGISIHDFFIIGNVGLSSLRNLGYIA